MCDRQIAGKILQMLESNAAICIQDVVKEAGCCNMTAGKHLARIVNAGLAIEKRVGRIRIFISKKKMEDRNYGPQ